MDSKHPVINSDQLIVISSEFLENILNAVPSGMQILRSIRSGDRIVDFEYVIVNTTAKAFPESAKVGKTFLSHYHDPGKERFVRLAGVTETGVPFEFTESIQIQNSIHVFKTRYTKFGDGVLIFQEDITCQAGHSNIPGKNAEKDPNQLLQDILDTPNVGLTVFRSVRDEKGNIIDFEYLLSSKKGKEFLQRDDIIGKRLFELLPAARAWLPIFKEVVETGVTSSYEAPFSNGNIHGWYLNSHSKFRDGFITVWEDITARKQAESVLENFKLIVDNAHDAIISMDMDGKINYWNSAAESLFGYRSGEVTGKEMDTFIVPDNKKEELTNAVMQVHKYGKPIVDLVTQRRNKQGELLDVILNIFPLKDDTGKITGSCRVSRDITGQNKVEQKIKEDAHFIGQVMDTTPDIIFIMDLNTQQVIYSNCQVAADLGYTKQQIADMKNPIFDIMHEDDIPLMMEHLKSMKTIVSDDKVVEIEYRLRDANGGIHWFIDRNAVFKRNSLNIPVEKIGISRNITSRKEQEQQILTSHGILYQAEDIAGMGSWEYDIASGDFKWSDGMYNLFNLPKNIPVTPDIYVDYTPRKEDELIKGIINKITNEYAAFEEIITLVPPGHEKKTVKIKAVVIRDKKKKPVKIIGVDLDITDQVRSADIIHNLNAELKQSNLELNKLNTELRTFNTVTANDYKETLQVLYTNLEYIVSKDANKLSDTSKANIRRAQSAVQKMKLLTDDINTYLELYEMPAIMTSVDPNEILRHVLSVHKRKIEQADAKVELSHFPIIFSHPALLSQLFNQLLDNAVKFRKVIASPVIRIKYSQADEMNAIAGTLKNTPYGIISVADNGIGFKEEEAEKIFDLFYRLHDKGQYRGSGIGLAICKKIMTMHGGFITAEGNPANGAVFNCYFPLKKGNRNY